MVLKRSFISPCTPAKAGVQMENSYAADAVPVRRPSRLNP